MLRHIITLLMAATLTGGLFASEAQARGGGSHGGGLGGGPIGGFHEMRIRSEMGEPHMGSHFGISRISGGFAREIDGHRPHDAHGSCHPNCSSLVGCRSLWQYSCL